MTDETPKTYDGSISDLLRALINDLIADSQKTTGDTPREKIKNHFKFQAGEGTLNAITALSSYATAKAAERQADAVESLAKSVASMETEASAESNGQAIIDQRDSKREFLATTYSLPFTTAALLWSIRGMLLDASLKSLSKPERFEPYRRVTTDEIAWTLRVPATEVIELLPRTDQGTIDFELLEEFDIYHYGGTDEFPNDWMFGG